MQLKPDCIRDVLLYLEDNLTIELDNHNFSEITLEQLRTEPSLKEKYTEEDIWYTVYNLKEVRFIEGRINDAGSNLYDNKYNYQISNDVKLILPFDCTELYQELLLCLDFDSFSERIQNLHRIFFG